MTKRHEKGSLMIEILAVLALISLITPMLFKQVSRRNEEVTRINIATEIRSIKDALSAYIQVHEEEIASSNCLKLMVSGVYQNVPSAVVCQLSESQSNTLMGSFLYGNSASGVLRNDYLLYFIGRTVPVSVNATGSATSSLLSGELYRPSIVGLVVQKKGSDKLSDASRIASLIGTEGGVVLKEGGGAKIVGIGEAWTLDNVSLNADQLNAVAAVTSFDADTNTGLLNNLKLKDFIGNTAQADYMGAGRLNALEFLSVGPTDQSCVTGYGTTGMKVLASGEKDGSTTCDPLFEVNGTTGEVRMKGAIISDEKVPDDMYKEKTGISCTDDSSCPAGQVCDSGECIYGKYSLDPAYTSVMNDIKLTSRGGARLSEILPNYISKNITAIKSGDTVAAPTCPDGYIQAITVQPTTTELGKVTGADLQITGQTGVITLKQDNKLIIRIAPNKGGSTDSGYHRGDSEKVGNWTVTAQFTATDSTTRTPVDTILLAHTYCVFDPANFTGNKLPEKSNRPRTSNTTTTP